jgi:succinoglycan biosynthesis transport protein ExoP
VNLGTYKPDFPKMLQTKAQIAELELRIKAEVAAVLASVKAQYDAARRQEDLVRVRLQETRKEVIQTQDKGVDLSLLKRELDTNRQIYDNLLQRLKEVGVTSRRGRQQHLGGGRGQGATVPLQARHVGRM